MIRHNERGQITVFLSMAFLVFTGLSFCVLEGIHGYMESSLAKEAAIEAGDEILANYDKYIFQKYHVFFLDPRERNYLENDAREFLKNYMDASGFYGFHCQELNLTKEKTAVDEKGLFLKYQISEYMKYQKAVQVSGEFKKLVQSSWGALTDIRTEEEDFNIDEEEAGSSSKSVIKEKEEQEGQKEETLLPETVEYRLCWSRIRQLLDQVIHSGILLYAADQPQKLSSSRIHTENLPSARCPGDYSGKEEGGIPAFSWSRLSEWRAFLKAGDFSEAGTLDIAENKILLDYLFQHFSCYGKKVGSGQTALQYELEYLTAGKSTDRDNLRCVADRIMLMRFLVNYGYASHDSKLQSEAAAMSEALAGFLGFPEGQKAVQVLLTAAISYGESLLELHTLMSGGKIALFKNSSNWNISFENAPVQLKNKSPVKKAENGIGYEDYLKLFICLKLQKEFFIYRVMDIMQVNTELFEPGFRMEDCLFSFEWNMKLRCSRWFVNFPGMHASLNQFFSMEITRYAGY